MSALHTLARLMLHAGVALAPKHRADWTRAMQAEFEAIEAGTPALEWALGCLATAAGWRLRADGGHLLAFAAAVATSIWFRDHWLEYAQPGDWNLAAWDNTMLIPGLTLPFCILAAGQRDRPQTFLLLAIAVGIAVPVWINSEWRETMLSSRSLALPVWAWMILGLMLALPGAIAAAICWRLRADSAYVTALIGITAAAWWLDRAMWDQFPDASTGQFSTLATVSPYISLALPCLLLCVYRPDRTMLTLFVTLLLNAILPNSITFLLPLLADPFTSKGNHPEIPNILMALLSGWSLYGAGLAGAAGGWTLGTLGRRLRPA